MELIVRGKASGTWRIGGFVKWGGVPHILTGGVGEMIPVSPETVGLYIGKKDRNKQRIFEGDVIRNYFELDGKPFTDDFVIFWDEANCGFFGKSTSRDNFLPVSIFRLKEEEIEVIGSIFDEPKKKRVRRS